MFLAGMRCSSLEGWTSQGRGRTGNGDPGHGVQVCSKRKPFPAFTDWAAGRRECWNAWLVGEHSPLCLQMRQQHPTTVPRGGGNNACKTILFKKQNC